MTQAIFLGIDLGTSEVKVVLMDLQGLLVGSAHAGLELTQPEPGWSEQDPAPVSYTHLTLPTIYSV